MKLEHMLRNIITPGSTVLDVGANRGQFARLVTKSCPEVEVIVCFEAVPSIFFDLCVSAMGDMKLRAVHRAVTDSVGHVEIYVGDDPNVDQASTLFKDVADPRLYGKITSFRVESESLDSFCDRTSLQPTFIKIDVERSEEGVIMGARRLLFDNSIPMYFEWGWTPYETPTLGRHFDYLRALGYELLVTDIMRFGGRSLNFWQVQHDGLVCSFDHYFVEQYSKQPDGALNILAIPSSYQTSRLRFWENIASPDFLEITSRLASAS